jgi:hypothetical protein
VSEPLEDPAPPGEDPVPDEEEPEPLAVPDDDPCADPPVSPAVLPPHASASKAPQAIARRALFIPSSPFTRNRPSTPRRVPPNYLPRQATSLVSPRPVALAKTGGSRQDRWLSPRPVAFAAGDDFVPSEPGSFQREPCILTYTTGALHQLFRSSVRAAPALEYFLSEGLRCPQGTLRR